jgi:hypothetical protein
VHVKSSLLMVFAALGIAAFLAARGGSAPPETAPAQTQAVEKVDMGDYEVVVPWLAKTFAR